MAPAGRLTPGPEQPSGPRQAGGTGRVRRPGRRRRLVVAALLLVPLLEIVVIIAVGRVIGPWWTIALLLAFICLGAVLVRQQRRRTWTALREAMASGRMPGRAAADAALVLVGGVLMLVPGFLTSLLGLFLILPFTRAVSRRLLGVFVGSRLLGGSFPVPPESFPGGYPGAGTSYRGSGTSYSGSGRAPGSDVPPRRDDDVIEGEIIDEDPPPGR